MLYPFFFFLFGENALIFLVTRKVMLLALHGPLKTTGCTKNISPLGTITIEF